MKSVLFLLLSTATLAFAVELGDTQDQVIAEKGQPQSQVAAGPKRVLQYADMSVVLKHGVVSSIRLPDGAVISATSPRKVAPTTPEGMLAEAKAEMADAIAKVEAIVNQPPDSLPHDLGSVEGTIYKGHWKRGRKIKPDFDHVDVRLTQEFPYVEDNAIVTCDTTLGRIFASASLEFNPMLEYFYTSPTLPAKRLMPSEMDEINHLYRIIGKCERRIAELEAGGPP